LTQRSHVLGAAVVLLLLGVSLSACGAAAVPQNWPGLTEADTTIYAISGTPQKVFLLNADSGAQEGTLFPQGSFTGVLYWSPVTIANGSAYSGFSDSQTREYALYAFDLATQKELWHVTANDMILGAPAYANGTVYFGASDGSFYAVDAATGSIKSGWPFHAKEAIWSSALVANGRVYVPSMDHNLYALDATTGEVVWTFKAGGSLAAPPILSNGILYVGSFDGKLYAIHADSGTAVEGFDFRAGNWIWSAVTLSNGQLFVTSLDGKLYALDPATGQVNAPYPYDAGSPLRAGATVAGNTVFIASDAGQLTALDLTTASVKWQWPTGTPTAKILTTPVVVGSNVYIILVDGTVHSLQTDNGTQNWTFTAPAGS
jgi:outer membrane protein assembly factor BamB